MVQGERVPWSLATWDQLLTHKVTFLIDVEKTGLHEPLAFGALRRPAFIDSDLSLKTKWLVYSSVVLGVLLCGAETWAMKSNHGIQKD